MSPERRNTLLLYSAMAVIVAAALALVGYGYYSDRVAPKHETVLKVGNRSFDYNYLLSRTRYEINAGHYPKDAKLTDVVNGTLKTIEQEELLRQAAPSEGINITDADINDLIRSELQLVADTPQDVFADYYRADVIKSKLTAGQYRDMIRGQLLLQKLTALYKTPIPDEAEQANLHIIQAASLADAQQAKSQLDSGQNFLLVASNLSIDSSKQNGGDMGWVPHGALPPEVETAAFNLADNAVSDIIQASDGTWYIAMSQGKETRPMGEEQKQLIVNKKLADLERKFRDQLGSKFSLTTDQINNIARSLLGA